MADTATTLAAGTDAYRFWRAKTKNRDAEPLKTAMGDVWGDPQPGLWKMRDGSRTAPFVPVKIWIADDAGNPVHRFEDGKTYRCAAMKGKATAVLSHDETIRIWSFCMAHPITQADRDHWLKEGQFPGEVAAPSSATAGTREATIGDNSRGTPADPFDSLKIAYEDYRGTCDEFILKATKAGGIADRDTANQAMNMADLIGDVKGGYARKFDELREELVAPHINAQREINGKFKPFVEAGQKVAVSLRALAEVWGAKEKARLQAIAAADAKKKQDEENKRRADELAKRQAEAAAQAAQLANQLGGDVAVDVPAVEVEVTPDLAPVTVAPAEVKVSLGGQRGAKRSLKTKEVATITDIKAAVMFFVDHDDMRALVTKLAQKLVDTGMKNIPGVTVTNETKL